MRILPTLLLLLAGLAGCLSGGGPDGLDSTDYDAIEEAIGTPEVGGHDHSDPSLHEAAYNLEKVAQEDGGSADAVFWQTALHGDYAYLTRNGEDAGLVIFDVSDIEDPTEVGSIRLHAGFEPDVEISADGNWAFWETQRFPTSAEGPIIEEPGANAQRGVHVVDISDKTDPTWHSFTPVAPDGPHSITYWDYDGRHILLQSVYAFAYAYAGRDVPMAQRLVISEFDPDDPTGALTTLAEYRLPEAQGNLGQMPHDVAVQQHPITGQWLAYLSYWDQGVVILDLSDPSDPQFVGKADDFGPATYGAIHMARPFEDLIGGRHVTVAEPEIGGAPDTGYMTFFDTTDPTEPKYISSWKIPGESDSEGGSLGPHYFDVMDGRVALAHYHAGFWVIDVHDEENLLQPRTVAYALVGESNGGSLVPVLGGGGASAFDAWWHPSGDYIVGGQMGAGLTVYKYTGPKEPVE